LAEYLKMYGSFSANIACNGVQNAEIRRENYTRFSGFPGGRFSSTPLVVLPDSPLSKPHTKLDTSCPGS